MRAVQIAFLGSLAWRYPALRGRLDEHLDDNEGEILPHVLMADYERWAEEALRSGDPLLTDFLNDLEAAYRTGGDEVEELISVSFLEHLPRPGLAGAELRELLGPSLLAQLGAIG